MAIVYCVGRETPESDPTLVKTLLASIGIDYERWEIGECVKEDASSEEILETYQFHIDRHKRIGGYVTADVIDVHPDTLGLDAMLARFSREHWHDEDEVRFILGGRGIFYIHPENRDVTSIEVEKGDWIRVPRGTKHWFTLCGDRRIRAIRLFQDPAGWTPYYTNSRKESEYEPVCFGQEYVPSGNRI